MSPIRIDFGQMGRFERGEESSMKVNQFIQNLNTAGIIKNYESLNKGFFNEEVHRCLGYSLDLIYDFQA